MKTIIKNGNKIIPTTYEFCCDKCGCIFRMTSEDLQNEQQSIAFTRQTSCPECGEHISGGIQVSGFSRMTRGVYEFRCNKCGKYFYKSNDDISIPDVSNIIHGYCPYCNNAVESSKDRFIKLANLDR